VDTEEHIFNENDRVLVRGPDTGWLTARIVQHVAPDRYAVRITETTTFTTNNIIARKGKSQMKKYVYKSFVPQLDITAFELAIIYRNLMGPSYGSWKRVTFTTARWDALPETISRHFIEWIAEDIEEAI
jgi:hypothetical protein